MIKILNSLGITDLKYEFGDFVSFKDEDTGKTIKGWIDATTYKFEDIFCYSIQSENDLDGCCIYYEGINEEDIIGICDFEYV